MTPAAAVSGVYLHSPQAKYFAVGRIGRDQLGRLRGAQRGTVRSRRTLARTEPFLAGRSVREVGYPGACGRHSWRRKRLYADHTEARRRARSPQRERQGRLPARDPQHRHSVPPAAASVEDAARALLADRDRHPRHHLVADPRGRGRRVSLLPPVGRDRSCAHAGGRACREDARHPGRASGRDRAHHRLRPPARRRVEPAVALRHDHARARRSGHEVDFAALVPARPRRADLLPAHEDGQHRLRRVEWRPHQLGVLTLRPDRHRPHREAPHRSPDQLPDHGELPRVQGSGRQARRRVDGRRSALLQQEHRRVLRRLRKHQPAARLPVAVGTAGARFRALPAHRRRPPPQRAAAGVRARAPRTGVAELLGAEPAEPRQFDHEEHRSGRRRSPDQR